MFGNGGHDVDCETVCLREIDSLELNTRLHQIGDERDIAGESIKLGDNELSAPQSALFQGRSKLRAIRVLAALDLGKLSNDVPIAAVQVLTDCGPLGLKPKPGFALPRGRDAVLGDKIAV